MAKSPAIFNGIYTKLLTIAAKFRNEVYIHTGVDDPRIEPTIGNRGSLYLRQASGGQVFIKNDDGITTNWRIVSDGSGNTKVDLYDPVSTVLPSGANATLDGIDLIDGMIVFFNSLSVGTNNAAYRVSGVGSSLSWELLPIFSGNESPTKGDKILVLEGDTFAGQKVYFDGTNYTINDVVRYFDGNKGTNYRETTSIKTLNIENNSTNTVFSINPTGSENLQLHYSIKRGNSKDNGTAYIQYVPGEDPTIDFIGGYINNTGVDLDVSTDSGGSGEITEDTAFYTNLGTGFNGDVRSFDVDSDGKILVGGNFFNFNGNTRNRLIRLNSDGTEDTAFYTNLGTGFQTDLGMGVASVVVQPDGKILVGGNFDTFNGNTRNYLIRLNSDGTEDTAFYTNLGTGFSFGINADVWCLSLQPDGKILVGGNFTTFNGNTRNRLIRLNSDGTEDTAFYTNLGTGFNGGVRSFDVDSDGKILVGGNFTTFNGNTRNRLIRLNNDGTEDTAFYTNLGTGFNSPVSDAVVQPDGKILVGGNFTTFNGNTRDRLIRLNSDGTEDTAFYTNLGTGFNNEIRDIQLDLENKILVGGYYTLFDSNTRNYLVRLNSDGTEDTAFYTNFSPMFNNVILAVKRFDENIFVGGQFTSFNGDTRNRLVRLDQEIDPDDDLVVSYTSDSSGEDGTMKFWLERWSDSPGGPSGVPNYSTSSSSNVAAAGGPNDVQFHGPDGMLAASSAFKWNSDHISLGNLEIHPLNVANIINNSTNNLITYPVGYKYVFIEYSVERGASNKMGTLQIVNDGTNVEILDNGVEISDIGVVFDAIISSGSVVLQYTSTDLGVGGVFSYSIRRWQ